MIGIFMLGLFLIFVLLQLQGITQALLKREKERQEKEDRAEPEEER